MRVDLADNMGFHKISKCGLLAKTKMVGTL